MAAVSRTRGKRARNAATWSGLCLHPLRPLFTLARPVSPPSTASFSQAVYPVYTGYNGHLFPETRSGARGATGAERRGKPSRDPIAYTAGESLKASSARDLKPRGRAVHLIRSARARLGIQSLNNAFWVVDWLTAPGFYCCSLSLFSSYLSALSPRSPLSKSVYSGEIVCRNSVTFVIRSIKRAAYKLSSTA